MKTVLATQDTYDDGGARAAPHAVWFAVLPARRASPLRRTPFDAFTGNGSLDTAPACVTFDMLSWTALPCGSTLFDPEALRDLVASAVDLDRLIAQGKLTSDAYRRMFVHLLTATEHRLDPGASSSLCSEWASPRRLRDVGRGAADDLPAARFDDIGAIGPGSARAVAGIGAVHTGEGVHRMTTVFAIAMFVAAFCLIANRLTRTVLTPPMIFLGLGAALGHFGLIPAEGAQEALHIVAEVALIVLLFLDAAQVDVVELRARFIWPARMLVIGLPLAVVFGTLAGLAILPDMSLVAVALVAAILAPTDAALGQAVVTNPEVPARPRQALVVESGLNDGLALPLILMLAVIAAPSALAPDIGWAGFAALQLTLGPLVGVAIGWIGGRLLLLAQRTGATSDIYEGIGALALAAGAYLGATIIGGNGFIATFTAGLAFGAVVRGRCAFVYEFSESEGQFLSWSAFLLLGAVLVPDAVAHLTLPIFVMILVSLLVVRPLAIWLSLIGTDATPITRLFFGWFGPRGLATALFALVVVEQLAPELGEQVLYIALNAVWISALLHGLSALPGAAIYARLVGAMPAETRPLPPGSVTGPRKTKG